MAAQYLVKQGYRIIEHNYRCKIGEIDIIAMDNEYLVFIEVKYRKGTQYGNPLEAINKHKQNVIYKVARFYMLEHRYSEYTKCRFDAVGILNNEITLIKDAF